MEVKIHSLYTNTTKVLSGEPKHLVEELLRLYPWLHKVKEKTPSALVERLTQTQAYSAQIVAGADEPMAKSESRNLGHDSEVVQAMLGYHSRLSSNLEAARFLSGGAEADGESVRRALHEADGDPEEAALAAYGIEHTPANVKALRAVHRMHALKKSQESVPEMDVQPGHPDADDVAEQVQEAFRDGFVLPVQLGGKHSAGSMLARDQATGTTWLLKPGSGGQTPAAGAREERASQSRREAAFYHVAEAWGLGHCMPEAQLLLIEGKEYAAIKLLPWSYETMDKVKEKEPGKVRNDLQRYLGDGILHRWAVLDYVLGNPDRHANNLMVRDGDVKLIDHGSAMAGADFDPAHDQNSFVPFYLRAWATSKFNAMDDEGKLKVMPRLVRQTEDGLRHWLDDLQAQDLDRILYRYGVNPEPAKARLARLKTMATSEPADLAVNKAWATT